jgi:dienelactone hydrolase
MSAVAVVMALGALPSQAQARRTDVDLKAADGTTLKATYFAAERPGPGVVLLHMCNSQRKAWDGLGALLAARGIHAIAVDYRGYGESGGQPMNQLSNRERQRVVGELWPGDIRAVLAHLVAQPGVDRARIGAAGGSCGVDNAVRLAMRQPEVKTLVLLAGRTGQAGEEYLAESAWLPVLGVAAEDDGPAVRDMRWLVGFSSHAASRVKAYSSGGHGTDLFAKHADLEPMIADWFEQHLVKTPVVASTAIGPPGPSARVLEDLRAPGGGARVLTRYHEARGAGTTVDIPSPTSLNALGYEALQGGRAADAVALFRLNVEAYPESANALDSLADGYLAAGDKVKALEFARKALDALARDTQTPEDFKARIRESAEQKIQQLRATPSTPKPTGAS